MLNHTITPPIYLLYHGSSSAYLPSRREGSPGPQTDPTNSSSLCCDHAGKGKDIYDMKRAATHAPMSQSSGSRARVHPSIQRSINTAGDISSKRTRAHDTDEESVESMIHPTKTLLVLKRYPVLTFTMNH
eukprot:12584371-Heterocapsa_arctica.AAC.1